jgi:2-amino-4-hydroxy-6-hydroxymethyldihydropteridine diphosphokinase
MPHRLEKSGSRAPALVALGSNLGDSVHIIVQAVERLRTFTGAPLVRSSLWRSDPIDCPPGSPPFVNAAVAFMPTASETPESLLLKLQQMERECGRMPKRVLNEARPLDLDLIAFGSATRQSPTLTLPHPRAHVRRFVLQPLAEIAPDFILPGQSQSVRQLLESLGAGQRVTRIEEGGA